MPNAIVYIKHFKMPTGQYKEDNNVANTTRIKELAENKYRNDISMPMSATVSPISMLVYTSMVRQ